MSETVCVTLEQLRSCRNLLRDHPDDCPGNHPAHCTCGVTAMKVQIDEQLLQAYVRSDWQPKVGGRVRLKAMPEAGPFLIAEIDPTQTLFTASRKVKLGWRDQFGDMYPWESRYLAELMPEEGE